MAIPVDNSGTGGTPGRPVRHQDPDDQNKTAENKGVWEFARCCAPGKDQLQLTLHWPGQPPGSLWSFNPTNS